MCEKTFHFFEIEYIVFQHEKIYIRKLIENNIKKRKEKEIYSKSEWTVIRRYEYLKLMVDICVHFDFEVEGCQTMKKHQKIDKLTEVKRVSLMEKKYIYLNDCVKTLQFIHDMLLKNVNDLQSVRLQEDLMDYLREYERTDSYRY